MKFYDLSIIIIVSIVLVAGAVGLISAKFLGNDNPIEQEAEKIIKDETGIEVDLTPTPTIKK